MPRSGDEYSDDEDARQGSKAVSEWSSRVSQSALAFEARWTWLTLRRVDVDLAERLVDQRNLFVEACVTGKLNDIEVHGAAMCRGHVIASKTMEDAGEPDDACQIGRDPRTGTIIAVGHQKAAAKRAREQFGDSVIFITPDELAELFGGIEALKTIGAVKQQIVGSEVVRVEKMKGEVD